MDTTTSMDLIMIKTNGSDNNYIGCDVLIKCPNITFINKAIIDCNTMYIPLQKMLILMMNIKN